MDITVPIPRKNTINVAIPEKNTITVEVVRKNTLSVQIDTPTIPARPAFVSAEVGLIDAYTIDILFDLALNESKIPDAADLIPVFSGGATQIYDRTITGLHVYAATGVSAWYLPSKDELNQMYVNLYLFGVGGFNTTQNTNKYASSSEKDDYTVYGQYFYTGEVWEYAKNGNLLIRACRSFTSQKVYALRDAGPAGGWIFYKDGNNYLETAPSDQSNVAWSNITNLLVGTNTTIGTGQANTTAIINQAGHTTSAAKICDDLVIGRAISQGETGTIQYVPNADNDKKLQGTTAAKVAAFTEDVTNNVVSAIPVLQTITVENAAPTVFVLTYDIALDDTSTPDITAFTITGHTVSSVLVTGSTCKVTVTERVYWNDSDTLAYTKPATNMIKSTLGGEAATFTATAVTNNVTQLAFQNANTLMWLLSEDLTTITKDGSNLVSRWNDRQASGRDLIQAAGTSQPLWSSTGVLFDGVDNFMASDAFTFNQPEMIYIVMKQVTWTLNDQFWDGFTALSGAVVQTAATPNIRLWAGQFQVANTNLAVNTFAIIRALTNGTGSTVQVNTTAPTTGTAGANNMGGFTLAKRATSIFYGNIQVKEVIIRNTADDSTVQTAIYSYLSAKYGI